MKITLPLALTSVGLLVTGVAAVRIAQPHAARLIHSYTNPTMDRSKYVCYEPHHVALPALPARATRGPPCRRDGPHPYPDVPCHRRPPPVAASATTRRG